MTDRNSRVRPLVDGSIVLPGVIDFNLECNYAHPFFVWSNDDSDAMPHTVTQGEFARASHRVAHIVRPLGQGVNQEVVAIIANIDTILYIALLAGIIRAGFVVSCFLA
jgi:acyl-coenzyme A synthetase/AMP-(fatty) acid ligase